MSATQENLLKAIAGESLARNKYTFFAKRAREEGYEGIARIFEQTADNERAHAERLLEFVRDGVEVKPSVGIQPIRATAANLEAAAAGENYEYSKMYPEFKKIAEQENEQEIATVFKEIAEVEEKHEIRYLDIIKQIKANSVFSRGKEIEWKCLNCGYIHKGKDAPETCPACGRPQSWYEPRGINW